jgi:hypothetical protein
MSQVPHYESETESEESEEDGIPRNKKQGRDHYEWTTVECEDPNSALLNEACCIGYVKFTAVAKNIPIGQKRKKGRPSKCKKALIRQ